MPIRLSSRPLHLARPNPVIMSWGFLRKPSHPFHFPGHRALQAASIFTRSAAAAVIGFVSLVLLAVFFRLSHFLVMWYLVAHVSIDTYAGLPLNSRQFISTQAIEALASGQTANTSDRTLTIHPQSDHVSFLTSFQIVKTPARILSQILAAACQADRPQRQYLIIRPASTADYQQVVSALDLLAQHRAEYEHCEVLLEQRQMPRIDA